MRLRTKFLTAVAALLPGFLLLGNRSSAQSSTSPPDQISLQQAEHLAKQEIAKLQSCSFVTKLTPAPIHAKVIWQAPSEVHLASLTEEHQKMPYSYDAVIEFVINYGQTDFFSTEEAAKKAQHFYLDFATRHRHTYALNETGVKLIDAEYFNDSSKKWKKEDPPAPFCWEAAN